MKLRTVVPLILVMGFGAPLASAQEIGGFEIGARGWMGDNKSRFRKGISATSPSRLNMADDTDGEEGEGSGFDIRFLTQEGHAMFLHGFFATASGTDVLTSDLAFGTLTIPAGTELSADMMFRTFSVGFLYKATTEEDPIDFYAGLSMNWLTAEVKLLAGGTAEESLSSRSLHYPLVNLAAGYQVADWIRLEFEGGVGAPSYTKAHGDHLRLPYEGWAGLRLQFGTIHFTGGFQASRARIETDANTPGEESLDVLLAGFFAQISAKF